MANIHIKRKHNLARKEAKAKVDELATDLQGKLGVSYRWDGDCLCFQRSGATGTIDVREESVEVEVKLGMLLRPMTIMIESSINEGLDAVLAELGDSRLA